MSSENSTTTVESVESNSKYDVAVWRCVGHTQKDDAPMVYAGRGDYGSANFKNSEIGECGWLGNPYKEDEDGTRREVVEQFATDFDERLKNDPKFAGAIAGLAGKRLGCWCQQLHEEDGDLCHAEIIAHRAQKLARMADSDEGEDDDDDDDADASDGGGDDTAEDDVVWADGRNTELHEELPSLTERDAWRLAQMSVRSVDDVAALTQSELANKPLFEGDAELVMQEATTVQEKRRVPGDSGDDAHSTTDADTESDGSQSEGVEMNQVARRCTPETTVAVVAQDGHFEGMTSSQTRSKIQDAIARSPFDPSGIVAVSDFEGTEIDASIHLHNVFSEDEDDEYNRYEAITTPWDEIDGKDEDAIGEKTDADGQVVHRWFKGAPQQRDSEVIRVCDAIIALSVGGYVENLIEKAIDSGIPHYDDRKRSATYPDRQVTIEAFDDEALEDGHRGALDEDEGRDNPRSGVENTW
jgi:hypothetical protein